MVHAEGENCLAHVDTFPEEHLKNVLDFFSHASLIFIYNERRRRFLPVIFRHLAAQTPEKKKQNCWTGELSAPFISRVAARCQQEDFPPPSPPLFRLLWEIVIRASSLHFAPAPLVGSFCNNNVGDKDSTEKCIFFPPSFL